MKKSPAIIVLLIAVTLLLIVEAYDLVQVCYAPRNYPFGKEDLPWYYQNENRYKANAVIHIIWLFLTFIIGLISLFRPKMKKGFFVLFGITVLYMFLNVSQTFF